MRAVAIKKDLKRYLDLKVFKNKNNGQYNVPLPKRKMGDSIPKKVRVTW